MRVLIVLSHLMNKYNQLNEESISRADKAIEIFKEHRINKILTIGWDYRNDSKTPIAIPFKNYLITNGIKDKVISSDINSRDTVGDAIFSKINFIDGLKVSEVHIVTSPYHVNRAKIIFEKILDMQVIAHNSSFKSFDKSILENEKDSLNAFKKTITDEDLISNKALINALKIRHPFYNGLIHSKLVNINPLI